MACTRCAQDEKKKSAVGAVETGLVYALTSPEGKKYVGKTSRTLTQRQNTMPVHGTRLIREAIKRQGGIKQFRVEVLACCTAASLDSNEALYISRLSTLHPKGYNMDSMHGSSHSDAAHASGGSGTHPTEGNETAESESRCLASNKQGKAWLDAAMGGRVDELMQMIKDEPTLIHFQGSGLGQTALHWACAKGHSRAVRYLLEKQADLEATNTNHSRPLHAAAASGSKE